MSRWTHQYLNESGKLVYLTSQLPDGRQAFYFLLLSSSNRRQLYNKLDTEGDIDLESFGQVVHSGWGTPTERDFQFMREEYGAKFTSG